MVQFNEQAIADRKGLHDILGISQDRRQELTTLLADIAKAATEKLAESGELNPPDLLLPAIKLAKTPEEVAWCSYIVANLIQEVQKQAKMKAVFEALAAASKMSEEPAQEEQKEN